MADPAANKNAEPTAEDDDIEEIDVEEETGGTAALASQVMQNPQVLAALQSRLGSIIGSPSGYIQSLPKEVKRRIKALKKLQFKAIEIEAEFYEEVHKLECKYSSRYNPIVEQRKEIINGGVEPTDDDCDWPSDKEDEDELSVSAEEDLKKKAAIEDVTEEKKEEAAPMKGIPQFWLTVFKNVEMLSDMVHEQDEPILHRLHDIKVKFQEQNPMGFTLEFCFDTNDYFSNSVLTKEYIMRSAPDESEPLSFEGPEIIRCKGCTIDWKKGKNVTVKVVKKKQKHKGRGTVRTVTKSVQNDSFFHFFNPPTVSESDETEMDEDTEALLAADFEIGHFIRERVVPKAVLYFTGEAIDDDDDEEEEGYEEGEEGEGEDGEYDEDNDPDFQPPADGKTPSECKQQ